MAIAGAGLVGSMLGSLLAKHGYKVDIIEKRSDPRTVDFSEGRSINLALSHRGMRTLEMAGVKHQVLQKAIPMKGRMIHNEDGSRHFLPYGKEGQQIYSVSRNELNKVLINAAEESGANIVFDRKISDINLADLNLDGRNFDFLFGADGAFSQVRKTLVEEGKSEEELHSLMHGYRELTMPPINGNFAMEPNALHIWPREQFMLIALPNADKTFTCTLFLPFEGEQSFDRLKSPVDLNRFFSRYFADVLPLIPNLADVFFQHSASSLTMVKAFPWVYKSVCLLGDSAHAIVPFYGQGMNAGFEDCRVLYSLISAGSLSGETLLEFQKERKVNADAIAALSMRNFVEMRDLVKDRDFQLRKKIEAKLHEDLDDLYIPLYTMVTFSDKPYSEALEVSKRQDELFEKILQIKDIYEQWEEDDVWNKIKAMAREIR